MIKNKLVPFVIAVLAAFGSIGVVGAAVANAAVVPTAVTADVSKQLRNPGPPKTPCNQRNDGQTTVGSDGTIWECSFEGGYFHWIQVD
ncbi:hypothetical protein ACW9HR_20305 [Nocardia gipuzkoensis]